MGDIRCKKNGPAKSNATEISVRRKSRRRSKPFARRRRRKMVAAGVLLKSQKVWRVLRVEETSQTSSSLEAIICEKLFIWRGTRKTYSRRFLEEELTRGLTPVRRVSGWGDMVVVGTYS